MCGIFGVLGSCSPYQKKLLAVLNEERGDDSVGIFNGIIRNRADCSVTKALTQGNRIQKELWETDIFLGHTRNCSPGMGGSSATKENAHPFRYNKVVGAHNGMISNWKELLEELEKEGIKDNSVDLDSKLLILALSVKGPEWLNERVRGSAAAWWMQKGDDKLYLLSLSKELHLSFGAVFAFSSDKDHLLAAGFTDKIMKVNDGICCSIGIKDHTITTVCEIKKKKEEIMQYPHQRMWDNRIQDGREYDTNVSNFAKMGENGQILLFDSIYDKDPYIIIDHDMYEKMSKWSFAQRNEWNKAKIEQYKRDCFRAKESEVVKPQEIVNPPKQQNLNYGTPMNLVPDSHVQLLTDYKKYVLVKHGTLRKFCKDCLDFISEDETSQIDNSFSTGYMNVDGREVCPHCGSALEIVDEEDAKNMSDNYKYVFSEENKNILRSAFRCVDLKETMTVDGVECYQAISESYELLAIPSLSKTNSMVKE